jgi:hypothetical protein
MIQQATALCRAPPLALRLPGSQRMLRYTGLYYIACVERQDAYKHLKLLVLTMIRLEL